LTRAGSRRRAYRGSRTFNLGAAGPGARRALTRGLITLATVQDDRLGSRNGRFENIVAEIGNRGHLRLQDVITQIRNLGASGDRAFENVAAHIWLSARRNDRATGRTVATSTIEAFKGATERDSDDDTD
jgi:hypothetical protein